MVKEELLKVLKYDLPYTVYVHNVKQYFCVAHD